MSVYSLLRIIHGYWRWAVFVLAVMVFARSLIGIVAHREWSRDDDVTMRRFFNALDLQIFLGLVLYFFFSPFWLATYQTFGETMRSPVARFFWRRTRDSDAACGTRCARRVASGKTCGN